MREIRFRAWDGKRMCVVENIDYSPSSHIAWRGWYPVGVPGGQDSIDVLGEHPVQPIMQYTGLIDKKGKYIYEGDIVKFIHNDIKCILEIFWNKGLYRWSLKREKTGTHLPFYLVEVCETEVIGNIYEHPNLLTTSTD